MQKLIETLSTVSVGQALTGGVTVVADASLDAEGFSTTLVALGIKEGAAFVDAHPQIRSAYFVDHHDRVIQVP